MSHVEPDTVAVVSESGSANLAHASGFGTPAAWESAYNTGLWQALVGQVANVARTQHEPSWPFSRLNFKSCLENTLLRALVQGGEVKETWSQSFCWVHLSEYKGYEFSSWILYLYDRLNREDFEITTIILRFLWCQRNNHLVGNHI